MPVKVIYQDKTIGVVDTSEPDELICPKKIRKFLRSEGWCTTGSDLIGNARRSNLADRRSRTGRCRESGGDLNG